ncbi:hypothetical protein EVAR_93686_1 [Eumeta japonica]|uniref:Uncharacterized protein n=1 Tax=Eumeta variegata TaxID=151549 RepID=A0A4C1U2N3_EUMVA|nr:hypothetical protein EVAR_93686_1 [Eumeta japonica]
MVTAAHKRPQPQRNHSACAAGLLERSTLVSSVYPNRRFIGNTADVRPFQRFTVRRKKLRTKSTVVEPPTVKIVLMVFPASELMTDTSGRNEVE